MPYGFIASMKTRPGKRDQVIGILLSGLGAGPVAHPQLKDTGTAARMTFVIGE